MTLKEKFRIAPMVENGLTIIEKCENITDEFTIGFAEWCNVNEPKYKAGHLFEGFNPPATKRLLEIYKKEKQL